MVDSSERNWIRRFADHFGGTHQLDPNVIEGRIVSKTIVNGPPVTPEYIEARPGMPINGNSAYINGVMGVLQPLPYLAQQPPMRDGQSQRDFRFADGSKDIISELHPDLRRWIPEGYEELFIDFGGIAESRKEEERYNLSSQITDLLGRNANNHREDLKDAVWQYIVLLPTQKINDFLLMVEHKWWIASIGYTYIATKKFRYEDFSTHPQFRIADKNLIRSYIHSFLYWLDIDVGNEGERERGEKMDRKLQEFKVVLEALSQPGFAEEFNSGIVQDPRFFAGYLYYFKNKTASMIAQDYQKSLHEVETAIYRFYQHVLEVNPPKRKKKK